MIPVEHSKVPLTVKQKDVIVQARDAFYLNR